MDPHRRIRHLEREIRSFRAQIGRARIRALVRDKQMLEQKHELEQRLRATQDELMLQRKRLLPKVKQKIEILARHVQHTDSIREHRAQLGRFLNAAWNEIGIELEGIDDPNQYLARAGFCAEAILDFVPEVAAFIGIPIPAAQERADRFVERRMKGLERQCASAIKRLRRVIQRSFPSSQSGAGNSGGSVDLQKSGFPIPSTRSIAMEIRRYRRRSVLKPILRKLYITEEQWALRSNRTYLAVRRYLNGIVRQLKVQTEADLLNGLRPQKPGDLDGTLLLPGGRLPR